MTNILKIAGGVVAGVVIGLLLSTLTGGKTLGGTYAQTVQYFTQGIYAGTTNQFSVSNAGVVTNAGMTVGSTGTALARLNAGTCYLAPYATTIAATSSATVDCQATAAINLTTAINWSALPGVTFGDNPQMTLSTTTAGTTVGGLAITAAAASTTAGVISLRIYNATGATFTWPTTGTASGTASYLITK